MARLRLPAGIQFTGAGWNPRRTTALLGISAILFQAVLFAWHHYTVALPSRDSQAAASHVVLCSDQAPTAADDDCALCLALGHHNVTPVDLFTAPLGVRAPQPQLSVAAASCPLPSYLLFRSRAPPPA
jgi:hypothetical protein